MGKRTGSKVEGRWIQDSRRRRLARERERGEGGGKKKVGSGCKTRRRIVEGRGERKRAIKQTRRTETEM